MLVMEMGHVDLGPPEKTIANDVTPWGEKGFGLEGRATAS
jgi:hypothetical protein